MTVTIVRECGLYFYGFSLLLVELRVLELDRAVRNKLFCRLAV